MNGDASIVPDLDEVKRLWNPGASAYFDRPRRPGSSPCCASTSPTASTGTARAAASAPRVQMLKAKLCDHPEEVGEQGSIATTS